MLMRSGNGAYRQYGTISEKRRHPRRGCMKAMRQAVELMQHELLYLRQEMEFVKKIMNAGNSPKQGR